MRLGLSLSLPDTRILRPGFDPELGMWNTTPSQGVPTFSDNNHTVTGEPPNSSTRVWVNQTHANTGKKYFEFTAGTTLSGNDNIAFGDLALDNWVALWSTGFQANFVSFGTIAASSCPHAGDRCAMAFDLDNDLIWYVNFTSGTNPGHWNDDGTGSPPAANPGTGVGGASWAGKATIPANQPVYLGFFTNTAAKLTINLGDSAFVGTVPSGFTPWMF